MNDEAPPEAPVDTPERRRKRWLAAFALAACYGLSGYFISGDSAKASGVALLVITVFGLLFLVSPRLVDTAKPLSSYYLVGLA